MLAADVGGTTVDGAVVTAAGRVVGEVRRLASPDDKDAADVVGRLAALLSELRRSAETAGLAAVAVGLGIPGPFDYVRGVSWMRHKLPALHGVELRSLLERAVGLPVRFCNDAVAFALGVWWHELPGERRLVAVTVGTGLGSGFLVDGQPVGAEQGAPAGGEIWNIAFRDGILEDAVSRRALEQSYERRSGERLSVSEIAARARRDDAPASAVFTELGESLGDGLAVAVAGFRPTRVVCGGQIAKAFDLFGRCAERRYGVASRSTVPFTAVVRGELSLVGAAHHALEGGLPLDPGGATATRAIREDGTWPTP